MYENIYLKNMKNAPFSHFLNSSLCSIFYMIILIYKKSLYQFVKLLRNHMSDNKEWYQWN